MRPFFNQDNLKIKILNLLEQTNSWTYTDLATLLQVDRTTLSKVIKNLAQAIDQQKLTAIKLEPSKQGVTYYRAANFNLASLTPILIDQRFAIIFESSFNEHAQTITALTNKLYVSDSTTRRLVTLVNQTLKDYQIQIDSKTLRLTGSEANIRYAAFQYYWNTYGSVTWPFFVNELDIKKKTDVKKYDQLRYSFWMAICEQRKLKGHQINPSEVEFLQLIKQVDFDPLTKQTFAKVQEYCHLFGQVPLLYDRSQQLNTYLAFITPEQQAKLSYKAVQQELLMLKLCELAEIEHDTSQQANLKFTLLTDSDAYNRQQTISFIQQYFQHLTLEITENSQQADFILTNLTLQNSDIPTIYINVPLTLQDLKMITQQIQTLLKK